VAESEKELDLDEIAQDVRMNEPTLSPRNAAFLKSARELRKPVAPQVLPSAEPEKGKKKKKQKEEERDSSESREIIRIVSSLWKNAMDGVMDEMSEAFNNMHLDILMKIAQLQSEIDSQMD
jgi:hypothetical protein